MIKYLILTIFSLITISVYSQTDSLYLRLPEYIYTTTSSNYSVYYNNVILTQTPEMYSYNVSCPVGYADSMRYNLDSLPVGNYGLELQIKDSLGNLLESKNTRIVVTDNNVHFPDTLKILFIGNSLTYAGIYERYCKEFLESTGNVVKLLGTQHYTVQDSIDGIFHEGRGGWTWYKFCSSLVSPFVYGDYPGVDIQRYIEELLGGERPDVITIFLGINDLFPYYSSSLGEIDAIIDEIFRPWSMGSLIDEFEESFPNTPIGIVLTPSANERLSPWYNYWSSIGYCFNQWDYKQKQHRLIQRYIDRYKELSKPNFSMIPVYANIDTYNGYTETDPLHPNLFGYEQIANSFYGWIKYQISQWMIEPQGLNIVYSVNSVSLNWLPVNGATGYRIYRSTDPYLEFDEIDICTSPEYTDNDVTASNKYFYKIIAIQE